MSLISIKDAFLSFSNLEILSNSTLSIYKNERVCLIGKNGTGKSTLLKVINKEQELDLGHIIYKKDIKISYLPQENPKNLNISLYNFMNSGLKKNDLSKKKNNIDNIEIEKIIELIELKKNTLLSELSGGFLRKATLGRTLIGEPDVLLLDEPTNHLDFKTVKWLEKLLKKFSGSILFVSHDRNFIQNISTRIIDLDRGKLISWPGNYKNFIKLKYERINIENTQKKLFDKNLAKEEQWIRKSLKARSTRNEGRVKNLKILRTEYESYKKIEQFNNIQIHESKKNFGKIIFKLDNIEYCIQNNVIVKNFSSIIQHGDKLGLIGNNGCGKSTVIKILLGEKKPQKGRLYIGSQLKIAYFDQNKSLLNCNKSIIDNISYGKEKIIINGKEQHIIGYLKKFLFKPHQLQSLVKTLSGGECNRLMLARLFLKPSNVLILDEPTNDLDLETLELIEKIIMNYTGTVIIVSHDEEFINNTVNKCWLFKKNGLIETHVGTYKSLKKINNNCIKKVKKKHISKKNTVLKNNYSKTINQICHQIEKIELNIKNLQKIINQPDFFKKTLEEKLPIIKTLSVQEKQLENKIMDWEKLEKSISEKSISQKK